MRQADVDMGVHGNICANHVATTVKVQALGMQPSRKPRPVAELFLETTYGG